MDTVQGAFPPIRRLPSEMLAEIFLCYVGAAVHPHPTSQLPPPLLLGHICSTWRHIVHNTPKLWTKFSLKTRGYNLRRNVDHFSFAKAWLQRAHPYPLHVSLSVNNFTEKLSRILDAILPSADRLQELHLHLPYPYFRPLVDLAAGSMPLLESVNLSLTYDDEPSWMLRRIIAFATAPRLRSVSTFSPYEGHFNSGLPLPWSQLTMFYLGEHVTSRTCRDVLFKCTNLIECALRVVSPSVPEVIPHMPIVVLPHLRKLHLVYIGWRYRPTLLFQYLNLPALKDLAIDGRLWSHQIFMGFKSRSSLDLERLRLENVDVQSDELSQFLIHMQSLVELDIDRSLCVDNNLFDALRYREEDDHPLLPKLKTLHISGSDVWGYQIDDNLIANMIDSRWWTDDRPRMVSRFESVHVVLDDRKLAPRVQRTLRRFRRDGLRITLD